MYGRDRSDGSGVRRVLRVIVPALCAMGLLTVGAGAAGARATTARQHPVARAASHPATHSSSRAATHAKRHHAAKARRHVHDFDFDQAVTPGSEYLALGDSVTFGYEESNVTPAPDYADASSLLGYPEHLGADLGLSVANASCPGETSSSLIDASATSNGCENGYRLAFPLHVSYTGSQLAFAESYLRTHHDVRLVSLMIGANDFFVCQNTTADQCTSPAEIQGVETTLANNVRTILSAIRDTAHYHGQLAIVNYYSLDYSSATDNALSALLNQTMDTAAQPFGVEVADGFGELQAAALHSGGSTCNAGLLTQIGAGQCGIHPSFAGQTLLAEALQKAIRIR